jgi:DNA polymerase
VRNTWHDLETRSPVPIKDGAHRYAEKAEVMLWAFADGDGPISVWDVVNHELWFQDEISELWKCEHSDTIALDVILNDPQALMWWQNGGMFDLPVLQHAMPDVYARMPLARQRDTMVQAFAHGLPGGLDKLGTVLNLHEDHRKVKRGRELIRLFCIPIKDSEPPRYNDKRSHPAEWMEFIVYAAGDIVTMREAHKRMPRWNVFGPSLTAQRETALWHLDLQINYRGVQMDLDLAKHAVRAVDTEKARLARRTTEMTLDAVPSTTQRDVLLAYLLEEHGVTLPDMQSDTIERRLRDPEIPDAVRELLAIRLSASQNSVSKYKTLMKSVSADGRLRGTKQYCGAGRTGRWAGRLMQLDNMPRPTLPADLIESYILAMKLQAEDIVCEDIIKAASNAIRHDRRTPRQKAGGRRSVEHRRTDGCVAGR